MAVAPSPFVLRIGLAALVLAIAPTVSEAATLRVDGKRFTSIQEAVDAASPGDKIVISRGRYDERVVIDGLPGLTLVGKRGARLEGGGSSRAEGLPPIVSITASPGVTIQKLEFRHGETQISIDDASDGCRIVKCASRSAGARFDGQTIQGGFVLAMSNDVRVDRCTLRGFLRDAITVMGNGFVATRNRVLNGDDAFVAVTGDDARIERNTLRVVEDGPIVEIEGDRAVVCRNAIAFGGGSAVTVIGADARIERNVILGVHDEGICVEGDRAAVVRNAVRAVGDTGIQLIGSGHRVEGNRVRGTDRHGIHVEGDGAEISGNDVLAVIEHGVFVEGSGATVDRNGCEFAGEIGICVDDFDGEGATVTENRVIASQRDGIRVSVPGAIVDRNTTSETGRVGIRVSGPRVRVRRNRVLNNADGHGIEIRSDREAPPEDGNVIEDNSVAETMQTGFSLEMSHASISGNTARFVAGGGNPIAGSFRIVGHGNDIADNLAVSGGSGGYVVTGNDNILRRNVARDCDFSGFFVGSTFSVTESQRNVFDDCVATDCTGEGLTNVAEDTTVTNCNFLGNRTDIARDLSLGTFANDVDNAGNRFETGGPDTASEIPVIER